MPARADLRFVDGPGHRIAYRRRGSGRPIVLLHPLALSGAVWGAFADRLATDFDVIAPDARGHGASGWDGAPFAVCDLAEDVVALLDGLGLSSANAVGLSMGGSTAVTLAGRHPDRVDALFLADTTAWYGPDAVRVWAERADRVLTTPRPELVPFQVERWFTEAFRDRDPERVNQVVDIFLATDSAAHAQACRALGGMDSRDLLAAVSAPTLVVTGDEDYATPPAMGATIAAGVAHGQARVLDATRHLSLVEAPELALTAARHFTATPNW